MSVKETKLKGEQEVKTTTKAFENREKKSKGGLSLFDLMNIK